jgi:diguanylate cyclase (GGDEF)-like protein/PAS domain S-box-containing protein
MTSAPVPQNDAERLQALREYRVLDTAAEATFDRVTLLASRLLDVPIALLSFVDDNRQWFKSKRGLEAQETVRDTAFCAHAILSDDVFVVSDALEDVRFRDNPLVREHPKIRAYAGAPLTTPRGFKIGTICAIDHEPRNFSREQIDALRALAALAMEALELRLARTQAVTLAMKQFTDAEHLRVLLAAAPLAIVTGTAAGIVTGWNPAAERIFGWSAEEVTGKFLPYVPDSERQEFETLIATLAATREPTIVTRRRQRKDGSEVHINLAVSPLLDPSGHMQGFLSFIEDATTRLRVAQSDRAAARTDALTGLLNRHGMREALAVALQRADHGSLPVGLALFDIDRFKEINDGHGHQVGDEVLRWAAGLLTKNLRSADCACRWGGEELLAMFPDADINTARSVAARVCRAIAERPFKAGLRVTISAGVDVRAPGESFDAAIARADQRLYEAKAAGRNCVR